MFKRLALSLLLLCTASPITAIAGEGATVVFDSGTIVYLKNGYSQLISAFKNANETSGEQDVLELNIEGTSFAIDLREVVVICRDQCSALEVKQYRQSSSK